MKEQIVKAWKQNLNWSCGKTYVYGVVCFFGGVITTLLVCNV